MPTSEATAAGAVARKVDLSGCDMLTIRNGRIHRNDAYMNGAQMAQQPGALPPPGSFAERLTLGALNLKTRLVQSLHR